MGWEIWLLIALGCVIIECLTVDFTFLMFAGGSLFGAGVSTLSDSLVIQLVCACTVALLLLLLVRPWIKNRFNPRGSATGSVQGNVGKSARTLTAVDPTSGRVKIGGEVWSARSESGYIPEGLEVIVVDIDGAQAVVRSSSLS